MEIGKNQKKKVVGENQLMSKESPEILYSASRYYNNHYDLQQHSPFLPLLSLSLSLSLSLLLYPLSRSNCVLELLLLLLPIQLVRQAQSASSSYHNIVVVDVVVVVVINVKKRDWPSVCLSVCLSVRMCYRSNRECVRNVGVGVYAKIY